MARDLRDYQHLPSIVLRCFGINHCFWGFLIMILAFVELGITANDIEDYWNPSPNRWKAFAYYAPVAILFSSFLVSHAIASVHVVVFGRGRRKGDRSLEGRP